MYLDQANYPPWGFTSKVIDHRRGAAAMAKFFNKRGVGSAAGGRVGREDFPEDMGLGWMDVHLSDHAGNHIVRHFGPGGRGPASSAYTTFSELFPTELRATGIAVSVAAGRLGGMVGVVGLSYAVAGLGLVSAFVILAVFFGIGRDRRAAVGSPRRDRGTRSVAGRGGTSRCHLIRVDGTPTSMVKSMATRKVTLSIDHTAWALAQTAAARAGISPSAWLSAAARREAVRLGAGTDWGDAEAEALAYDGDLAAAEADIRAAR